MNVLKTPRYDSSFNLSRNPFLWFLPFTLLPISIDKALASEFEAMSQINNVRQLKSRQSPNILKPSNKTSQITNVQQLRDVSPTDWAYEALRSLVDRYGCISGFGDQTYRGSQPLSRYEFAAGLNSCLNQIERLIASSESVSSKDIATTQRLSQEFEVELATIGGRVEEIESRTAILEDNQFSTTTKLLGNLFVNITGATADGDIDVETNNLEAPLTIRPAARDNNNDTIISTVEDDPEITYSYYTWLNFNSSFSGRDNLAVQLVAGNATSPANTYISAGLFNTFGTPFTDQTGAPEANDVAIRELFYDFPIGDRLRVVVGPRINWYRYFDNNAYSFFLTGAGSFNSSGGTLVNPIDRGSGAVITYALNDSIDLKVGYLGENTEFLPAAFFNTSSDPNEGLFSADTADELNIEMNRRSLYH